MADHFKPLAFHLIGAPLVASAAVVVGALLTVSIQTIRAALANPIKSLRSE